MFEAAIHEDYQVPVGATKDDTLLLRELLIGETLTPNQEIVLRMLYQGPVRVYGVGDALTMDYRPDRLNIELDEDRCIVNVSFG